MKETDYLSYLFTPEGYKPEPKKVQAILHLDKPKTRCQVREFIGLVNYYRNMWPKCTHILAPLTALTSKNLNALCLYWADGSGHHRHDCKADKRTYILTLHAYKM